MVCGRPTQQRCWLPKRTKIEVTELEAPDRVFAVTCFYIRSGYRGRGLMRKLAETAVTYAKEQGAIAVDVCPIDLIGARVGRGLQGLASVFRALGFREIARRTPTRPLMRLDLSESAAA